MFLFPWSQMVGGILYEHSHRLLGALVGLLTLALAGGAVARGRPAAPRSASSPVAAVIVQGVLGGLRVVLLADTLAIFHGRLAQAFFALLGVDRAADRAARARRRRAGRAGAPAA